MEWRQSSVWLLFPASPSSIAATSTGALDDGAVDDGAVDEADGPVPVIDGDAGVEGGGVIGFAEGDGPPAMGGVAVVSDAGVGVGWLP